MNYREIRMLLDKYWQGESTLEEEEILKAFFKKEVSGSALPADLQEAAPLFSFYSEAVLQTASQIKMPWEIQTGKPKEKGQIVRLFRSYWEYAAIFLLLLGSLLLFQPAIPPGEQVATIQDTYKDPHEAMIATKKALAVLATNLNKGKEEMQKLALFHEAQQKVAGE